MVQSGRLNSEILFWGDTLIYLIQRNVFFSVRFAQIGLAKKTSREIGKKTRKDLDKSKRANRGWESSNR